MPLEERERVKMIKELKEDIILIKKAEVIELNRKKINSLLLLCRDVFYYCY